MVRLPKGWAAAYHPQAGGRGGNALGFLPGQNGAGKLPMRRVPIGAYTGKVSGIPLTGGQNQGFIPASGKLTLSVGPQGIGTVWYAAQVTISTTTGPLDTSTALIYQGPATILTPATLVGQIYTGNGTAALALPNMTPGQVVTVMWTSAHVGDTAALNIIGTMDALTTG